MTAQNKNKCFCGKEPLIYLHYASKHLCEAHFIRMFDKRIRKTIRTRKMLKKGDRIAVGLSGGKDSVILLHSLVELKKDLPFEIVAITIDEGIAGYRPKTLITAKRECKNLGIKLKVLSFKEHAGKALDELIKTKNAKPKTLNTKHETVNTLPCSQCGVIRRYLLNKGARMVGANKLAIGHNLDDMAQTIMMNIMRNEPARLARISDPLLASSQFVPRIKPLMLSPEKEIALYAMIKGIKIERIECPYAHLAFRSHVRKMLNETEEKYPGTKFKIMNSLLEIEDTLHTRYSKDAKLATCPECGEPSSDGMCMFCRMIGKKKR